MNSSKNKNWVVLKFGGTSVASAECWQTIKNLAIEREKEGLKPIIVCSAISGISNALEALIEAAVTAGYSKYFESIKKRHFDLASSLNVETSVIEDILETLTQLTDGIAKLREATPKARAQILACGELLSTRLGAAYLNANGVKATWQDVREILTSTHQPRANERQNILGAVCSYETDPKLANKLDNSGVIITQGFIAKNKNDDTVLLGRGGSDISAAYLSAKLGAKRCEIWTDVPGMFTTNPNQVPSARLLKTLDYEEAQEIASSGAKVLHPRSIQPLYEHNIPIYIKWLEHPHFEGTIISTEAEKTSPQVKAISAKQGITLISMDTVNMWHQAGFLADVFSCFKKHGVSIDLISTSEANVTVTLDQAANLLEEKTISSLVNDLKNICKVRVVDSCALLSLVGKNIRTILHQLTPAMAVFKEQKIYLLSQSASDLNLNFVIDEDQAERLVRKLHDQLFQHDTTDPHLGPSWKELFDKEEPAPLPAPWWKDKKNELIELAEANSPLYVYNSETVKRQIAKLSSLKSLDRTFYALKANAHPDVLKNCFDAGLGFECVSPFEIDHILKLFPNIDRSKILFTPNFAPREEYEYGFKAGVFMTLDNAYPIQMWPQTFKGREVLIRIDPGEGRGHHKYVKTAGSKSKFGVWPSELPELKKLIASAGTTVIGLHAHVGSNIFNPDTWSKSTLFLASVAKEHFPDVKFLDAGGGLGVVEKPGQKPLDIEAVEENLRKVKEAHPEFEIWMEPGRFIVAEAGVLLGKVTQTKQKGDYFYIGTNIGMNTLIRPALYGAYQEITNISRLDEDTAYSANIVGPICESGDILGYSRRMPITKDGDIILIATTGAYGFVMSSNYNMRPPAKEHFLK